MIPAEQRVAEFNYMQAMDPVMRRLVYNTPLTPDQARSLIREHGLEFAERVGELVSQGWGCDWAAETLTGQHGRWWSMRARQRLDAAAAPGGAAAYFPTLKHWPRGHGTPSSFGEVLSDAAVAKHQPVLTPCATCRNHDNNPYLSCAIQPLGRPGHECSDWAKAEPKAFSSDNGTLHLAALAAAPALGCSVGVAAVALRFAEVEYRQTLEVLHHRITAGGLVLDGDRLVAAPPPRIEARAIINGIEQVVWVEGGPSDRVPPERPWLYP